MPNRHDCGRRSAVQKSGMTFLAKSMEVVFVGAWCVGVAALVYASRYWLPMWASGFKKLDKHKGYMRKALTGFGVFILAIGVGFAVGGIAEYWGGGW